MLRVTQLPQMLQHPISSAYQLSQLKVINEDEDIAPMVAIMDKHRRHETHFFEDGDLVLLTSSVNFCVHIRRLQSTVLDSVLEPLKDGLSTKSHLIHMQTPGDKPSDWASLLGEIYNNR